MPTFESGDPVASSPNEGDASGLEMKLKRKKVN
jgi:hypothetical protein